MDEKINLILSWVKRKNKYNLKDSFILKEIHKVLASNKKLRLAAEQTNILNAKKSKEFKQIVKEVRRVLHRSTAQYAGEKTSKRDSFLCDLKKRLDTQSFDVFSKESVLIHEKILCTHKSSKERISIYPSLYEDIFKITGIPKSILDLGSGINPVSFPFMGVESVEYLAFELSESDCDFLNKYFKLMKNHIKGEANVLDLSEFKKNPLILSKYLADICFIWKVIEPLQMTKSKKLSEELIKSIAAKWIVVSFATKTLSGNKMNVPTRKWFELMINRLNYKYCLIDKENEIFYVLQK